MEGKILKQTLSRSNFCDTDKINSTQSKHFLSTYGETDKIIHRHQVIFCYCQSILCGIFNSDAVVQITPFRFCIFDPFFRYKKKKKQKISHGVCLCSFVLFFLLFLVPICTGNHKSLCQCGSESYAESIVSVSAKQLLFWEKHLHRSFQQSRSFCHITLVLRI